MAIFVSLDKNSPIYNISFDFEGDDATTEPPIKDKFDQHNQTDTAFSKAERNFTNSSEASLHLLSFFDSVVSSLFFKIINKGIVQILLEKGKNASEEDAILKYEVSTEVFLEISGALSKFRSINHAFTSYSKGIIIQLSTQFDILVADIVRILLICKPSVLDASDRKIDFGELDKYQSIEQLKEGFFEKTIENVIRKSRREQFAWLSEKLGMALGKDVTGWASFIEINERRNLFTHTEGVVTKDYIKNCIEAGCAETELQTVGSHLGAPRQYLEEASELFFVIGIKLIQATWRKLRNKELQAADTALAQLTYELNRSKKYKMSIDIGQFACDVLKNYSDERRKRIMHINYAVAILLSGDTATAEKQLARLDWSASGLDFQIAVAAIKRDVPAVCERLPQAISSEIIAPFEVEEWPLFYLVRDDDKFQAAFKKACGKTFVPRSANKSFTIDETSEALPELRSFISEKLTEIETKRKDLKGEIELDKH